MSGAPADEVRLARAAAAGDGAAFATLYDAYEGRIFNFCARLVGNEQDAADATQDAFLKVLQRLPKLGDRELNFGAYLFTAARNASYDIIGRRKRAEPVEDVGDVGGRPMSGDERGDVFADPERAAMLGTLQEQVRSANERLPDRQREVLALRELEELSYDEIAGIMDMNRNSVAQLISRARINLRDELRGSALASIAISSPDCERALPLISMRQDGQLRDDADRAWLAEHLASCDTCKVSVEAIEEAGVSYRVWAPVVVFAWLRRDTIAKAAELVGADWSDVPDRDGGDHDDTGVGPGGASPGRRRIRRAAAALLGIALLTTLFVTLVIGSDEPQKARAKITTAPPATSTESTTTATTTAAKPKHHKAKHRAHHAATVPATTTTTDATTTEASVTTTPAKPTHRTSGVTGRGGGGSTGSPVQGRPPLTGTNTTPAPPPPTTDTTPPPTTTTTTTTTTPTGCRGDPVCCRTHPSDPSCIRRPSTFAAAATTTTRRRR